MMRHHIIVLMTIGLICAPLTFLGCRSSCKLTPDPDCDWSKTDNHCTYICTDNQEQTDDTDDVDDGQDPETDKGAGTS